MSKHPFVRLLLVLPFCGYAHLYVVVMLVLFYFLFVVAKDYTVRAERNMTIHDHFCDLLVCSFLRGYAFTIRET